MRRTVFGHLSVVAAFAILFTLSCQRTNDMGEQALRIVALNKGAPLRSDLADFGIYRSPDPEEEPLVFAVVPDDVIEIELQYVELGLGLPTWTPYQANIRQVEISFKYVMGTEPNSPPDRVRLPLKIAIPSDPSGKKTVTGKFTAIPAAWKELYFDIPDDPFDDPEAGVYAATIKVSGVDDASGLSIEAKADLEVSIANHWDDPSRIGQ